MQATKKKRGQEQTTKRKTTKKRAENSAAKRRFLSSWSRAGLAEHQNEQSFPTSTNMGWGCTGRKTITNPIMNPLGHQQGCTGCASCATPRSCPQNKIASSIFSGGTECLAPFHLNLDRIDGHVLFVLFLRLLLPALPFCRPSLGGARGALFRHWDLSPGRSGESRVS